MLKYYIIPALMTYGLFAFWLVGSLHDFHFEPPCHQAGCVGQAGVFNMALIAFIGATWLAAFAFERFSRRK